MRSTSTLVLILLCILNCIGLAFGTCTVNKYEEGNGDSIQCTNETLRSVLDQSTYVVSAMMIARSNLQIIPEQAFARYSRTLKSLNIHQCTIADIRTSAFAQLSSLEKLALPNNKITVVKKEWFVDLTSLKQLDLSFNQIRNLEPGVFENLRNLRWLDFRDNRLTCLSPEVLRPMAGIDKIYFSGNPLSFLCRGKLTLWLKDHGVYYKTHQSKKETWLDSLLWLCAIDNEDVAKSEILMKECVILNLYNQLRTGLLGSAPYPASDPGHIESSHQCINARNSMTNCVLARTNDSKKNITNGSMIMNLLLQLRESKSA